MSEPIAFLCVTCGTQYPPSAAPPDDCPICLDERQYVGAGGQAWTTPSALAAGHANRIEETEPGMLGIGTEPRFAIGQRALLVDGLLWDCVSLLDDATAEAVGPTAACGRSRSRTRTTTRQWSTGPSASTSRSSCTPTTRST